MKPLVKPYNAIIIVIATVMIFMLVKSFHRADMKLLLSIIGSAIVFPITAFFLYKSYFANKNIKSTIILLLLVLFILSYYLYDVLFHTIDGIGLLLALIFGAVFICTIAFLIDLLQKIRSIPRA